MPLHLGTLTPEQILEINFLAGAIVSKKPEMEADKLVADLAAIYQSTDKSQVESQIAKLMEVKEADDFVIVPKEKEEGASPAPQIQQIPAEEVIEMAGKKLNLSQEQINEFCDPLWEADVETEYDLRAASDAKLRKWGLSDKMILSIKKTLNELATVRKIVHGESAVEHLSHYPEEVDMSFSQMNEEEENKWHCHGMGR